MVYVVFGGILNDMVDGLVVVSWGVMFVDVLDVLVVKLVMSDNVDIGKYFFNVRML